MALAHGAPDRLSTVALNIDTGLQQEVQNAPWQNQILGRIVRTPDAEDHNKLPPAINGAAIVLNPSNGQVLAMASYPSFDLNEWVGGISTANFAALQASGAENNYAIQGQYTPGSTFKLITATAALQDGVISAATYYNDTGVFKVPGCPAPGVVNAGCDFKDDPGDTAAGTYNLPLALTESSDSYFYNLGALFWDTPTIRQQYGPNAIQNVAAQYGEGEITGVDLPNEAQGRVDSQAEREKLPRRGARPISRPRPGTPATTSRWPSGRALPP